MKRNQLMSIVLLACTVPAIAHAQPTEMRSQKYCTELSKAVDRYIASDHGENHLAVQGYGKAACKERQPANAIPVLERRLTAAKLPLPPHPASVAEHPSRQATAPGS